ncbi:MAG: TRAP transporter permease [Granulosicoccus sp.]
MRTSPAWILLGALSVVFHLALIFSGLVPNLVSRPLHLALALPWVFLFAEQGRVQKILSAVLCITGICICLWIAFNQSALGDQYGFLVNDQQLFMAIVLLAIVVEMARRAIGWPLPMVAVIALAYGIYGHHLSGEFGFAPLPVQSFLGTLTIAEGGIWGSLAGISVGIVAVFVIFGAVLNAGEAGQGFMNLAAAAGGRLRGGAAKMALISSALFGSISGSASANVASTGAVTLPAMTRLGYPRSLAGATEAVASSGGQIMPPLMGAGAFVMVELTGVPYTGIMSAALLPALLYFFAVWMGLDAYSRRYDLKPLDASMLPAGKLVLISTAFFLMPFCTLLYGMFIGGYTPQYAACQAIIAAVLLLFFDPSLKPKGRRFVQRVSEACVNAGQQIATIAAIIFCASIIVGVLGITGAGVKVTSLILSGSGGLLWPALGLTALACLVLGMEVPTTAAYVICVSVAGPALIDLGLAPLQAHLFIFWFALLSTITPPVCGAVFIAAGMVQENWLRVAANAMVLGLGLYLIPLAMISTPQLLELSKTPILALAATLKMMLALSLISFGIIRQGTQWLRLVMVCGGLLLVFLPLEV